MCLLAYFGADTVSAQDPTFSQFYANKLYLNPAFAGSQTCPRVTSSYRNQWPALSGTFVTTSISYDQQVRSLSGGLGLLVTHDQQAKTLNTTRISGIYSYQFNVTRTFSIRAGAQATFFQRTLDWDKLTFGDMIDPRKGFIFPTSDKPRGGSQSNIDASAGIVGLGETFYGGVAVHHLLEPNESLLDEDNEDTKLPMKYTGHVGALIPLQDNRFSSGDATISPNLLYQQQENFQQFNMGLYVQSGPILGGLWFRKDDSFIAMVGLESGMFGIGYSYDVTVSKLGTQTAGAHEVSLTINFECEPNKREFRTVSCPSF